MSLSAKEFEAGSKSNFTVSLQSYEYFLLHCQGTGDDDCCGTQETKYSTIFRHKINEQNEIHGNWAGLALICIH